MRIRISLIRFLLEAGFIILVAAAVGLARLSTLWIGVVMFGAWLLVAFVERTGSRGPRRRQAAEEPVQELEPQPEPEPEPAVVPLLLRDPTPRAWNLWELEQLAATKDGDATRVEERALLLLHLRQFASAGGDLPAEFDPLVREAFGSDLAELVT